MSSHEPLTPTVLHVLLALLEAPRHGYALMQVLEAEAGVRAGPGTVYGVVDRLEDWGWVHPVAREGRRKVYGLTEEGHRALRAEFRRLADLTRRLREHGLADEAGVA